MVTAIVLIKAETNRIPDLADKIADMAGVSEVFSVAGRHDLVAIVRVSNNEDLAEVISTFGWMQAPVFEVREAPADLLRPLYRTLPRSFKVTDGEVTATVAGLPSL